MIIYGIIAWILFGIAASVHELAHWITARRRGAEIAGVSVGVPGLVVVFGPNGVVRPRLGRPHVRWRPGGTTSRQDEIWIFRAGPAANVLLTVAGLAV